GRTARTALIATAGFTDVIELGRQARPELYRLCVSPPAPLVPEELRFAAPERTGPDGPLRPLDPVLARELVEAVALARPQAVAVALLHSYAHPSHERLVGELVAELLPEAHLSLSCELVGTFREYERTATTVLDPALSPLLEAYLRRLRTAARTDGLPDPQVMQSAGGLTDSDRAAAHAALTVLSGPAGGVGGALLLAQLAGEPNVLCLDMGGTSCDVCVIEGSQVTETAERPVAGRPLSLPALAIHTVGAGGARGGAPAGRPRLCGRGSRTGLLRPRRRVADGDRRQPPARPAAGGRTAGERAVTAAPAGGARARATRARAGSGAARMRGG